MSEWLQVPLGDFADVQNRYAFKSTRFSDQGTPVIKIKNIASGEITWDEISFFSGSPQGLEKFLIHQGDVLIAMTGSHVTQVSSAVGKVARYNSDIEALLNQRVGKVYPKNLRKLDNEFLYYFLVQPVTQYKLGIGASGSANQANISPSQIKDLLIDLPPITEQKKIAAVLSSLDRKIENLRRQNETLEAIAQTLFKHWFVDFEFPNAHGKPYKSSGGAMEPSELGEIPAGWRVGKLGDEFDISIGRTPPRKESEWFSTNSKDIKWVSIKDMGSCGTYIFETSEYLTREAVTQFNIPVIPSNTVILSFKLTVGRLAITPEAMLSNEAIAHLKTIVGSPPSEYIYLFLSQFNFNKLGSTSSIATAVNSKDIKALEFIVPTPGIISNFYQVIRPLFSQLKVNAQQIKTLTKTRDTLLPKLMSGKLRIT